MTLKLTETVTTFGDLARVVDHARAASAQDHDVVVAQTGMRGTRDGRYLRSITVEVSEGGPRITGRPNLPAVLDAWRQIVGLVGADLDGSPQSVVDRVATAVEDARRALGRDPKGPTS